MKHENFEKAKELNSAIDRFQSELDKLKRVKNPVFHNAELYYKVSGFDDTNRSIDKAERSIKLTPEYCKFLHEQRINFLIGKIHHLKTEFENLK